MNDIHDTIIVVAAIIAAVLISLLSGCTAMNNLSESVKNKNIAAGSDTWGGNIIFSLMDAAVPLPNITLWIGRRKVWYVSLKSDNIQQLPGIIKSSNAPIKVGVTPIEIEQ